MKNFLTINAFPDNRFIRGLGSEVVFNSYKNQHNKLAYGQVIRGGHSIFSPQSEPLINGWDLLNSNGSVITDTVYNKVYPFINGLKNNNINWETRAFTWKPARESIFCNPTADRPTDTICFQKIYNPNPTYTTPLCDNNNKFAIAQYIHPDAIYTWSVNSGANISIQGSTIGTTIQYKRIANINKTDTLIVTITRPCAVTTTFKYVVTSTIPTTSFTPTITPTGWNTICSTNKTATLLGVPSGTPAPIWSATGNIEIVSSSGNSVTYKRKNNLQSTGILTATFSGTCGSPQFNFTVNTYPFPTLGNWTNTFGIVSQCDVGIVTSSPSKVPNGTNATFSTIYTNALQNGVTNLLWSTNCIIVSETQTWIGNDLREDYTITATSGCNIVQVRPQNICGTGSWKSTGISVEPCGGGGWSMMVAPNPANSYLEISLTNEDEKKAQQRYTLQVIAAMGNTIIKTSIAEGKQQLNISELKEGVYKAIIQTEDELLYRTFHVGR